MLSRPHTLHAALLRHGHKAGGDNSFSLSVDGDNNNNNNNNDADDSSKSTDDTGKAQDSEEDNDDVDDTENDSHVKWVSTYMQIMCMCAPLAMRI